MKFNVNESKTLETLIWIVNVYPGLDIDKAFLVLYYADKLHLNRYSRPVTGDSYTVSEKLIPKYASTLLTSRDLDIVHNRMYPVRVYNPDKFSQSDFECLWETVYKNLVIPEYTGLIPIEDMIDLDNEFREEILEQLKETAPYMLV